MLQINTIRTQGKEITERLKKKNFDASKIIEKLMDVDLLRRTTQKNLEDNLAESNKLAKEIGEYYKSGNAAQAEDAKGKTLHLKTVVKELQDNLSSLECEQESLLVQIPNIPNHTVPVGKSSDDNEITKQEGEIPELYAGSLPHWELASVYNLIDWELGTKITGAGFPVYKGKGAKLQRAIIAFFLDEAIAAGYTEYQPPLLVNEASAFATGQLPDKDSQMYHVKIDNLFLIPTAEVPITNIFRDIILKEEDLPVMCTAYSSCFRREAGSYGKDVRGLNRLHQFDKVEIVQIAHPDKSYQVLESMLDYVCTILRKLKLPFRVANLCGGDLSFASAKTYDLEVFSAAQKRWLEVSSISNFETFQSNRLKLRFKDKDGKISLVHTLNGSALALPRIVASLLENNQTPDGIVIPEVLRPYTDFDIIGK